MEIINWTDNSAGVIGCMDSSSLFPRWLTIVSLHAWKHTYKQVGYKRNHKITSFHRQFLVSTVLRCVFLTMKQIISYLIESFKYLFIRNIAPCMPAFSLMNTHWDWLIWKHVFNRQIYCFIKNWIFSKTGIIFLFSFIPTVHSIKKVPAVSQNGKRCSKESFTAASAHFFVEVKSFKKLLSHAAK